MSSEHGFPFERELREQHDALRASVRWLAAEVDRGAELDLVALLDMFAGELVGHFRFEERHGLAEALGCPALEVRRWGAELVRQHGEMEQRLDELQRCVDALRAAGSARAFPRSELAALLTAIRRHDAEENALLHWLARHPWPRARRPED